MTDEVRKIAVVVNFDRWDSKHLENAQRACDRLTENGYAVYLINPEEYQNKGQVSDQVRYYQATANSLRTVLQGLKDPANLDANDDFLFYSTGHGGQKRNGSLGISIGKGLFSDKELLSLLSPLQYGQRTLLMDQCFSGTWGKFFAGDSKTLFKGLSPSRLTTHCDPFQSYFWAEEALADLDRNGVATFAERMRYAIEQSGDLAYEQSVFFSGIDYVDDGFGSSGKTDPREPIQTVTKVDELDSALHEVPMEEYVLVAFTAPAWCDPCREMEEIYPKLPPHIRVIKVDLSNKEEDYKAFKQSDYQISAVPQFRLFGRGLPTGGMRFDAKAIGDDLPTTINRLITEKNPMVVFQEWLASEDYGRFKAAWRAFAEKVYEPGSNPREKLQVARYRNILVNRFAEILDGSNDSLKWIVLEDVPSYPLFYMPAEEKKLAPKILKQIDPSTRPELIEPASINWLWRFTPQFAAEVFRRTSAEAMLFHADPKMRIAAIKVWARFQDWPTMPEPKTLIPYHRRVVAPLIRRRIQAEADGKVKKELADMIIKESTQDQHPPIYRLEEALPLLESTDDRGDLGNTILAFRLYDRWEKMADGHEKAVITKVIRALWNISDDGWQKPDIEKRCPLIFKTRT